MHRALLCVFHMGLARRTVTIPSPQPSCGQVSNCISVIPAEVDALEMNGQIDELLFGKLLLIGIMDMRCNLLCAFIMLLAVAGDQLTEQLVPLLRAVLHDFSLGTGAVQNISNVRQIG